MSLQDTGGGWDGFFSDLGRTLNNGLSRYIDNVTAPDLPQNAYPYVMQQPAPTQVVSQPVQSNTAVWLIGGAVLVAVLLLIRD